MQRKIRNYDTEAADNAGRKYKYEFDSIVRSYFMESIGGELDRRPEAKTLEIGSFDGIMTDLLLQYFSHVNVVEASTDLARTVASKLGESVKVHNCLIEDFETTEKFDNIFLVHTLEHLDEPKPVLDAINGLLSENGKAFIMVPNANALSRQIAVGMGLVSHNSAVTDSEAAQGHVRTYSLDTLENEIDSSELVSERSGGVILKTLANFQFDEGLEAGIVSPAYVASAFKLGLKYPDFCSSIYVICSKGTMG